MQDSLEQALADFGRLMGLNRLAWNSENEAMLHFEQSGTLSFQVGGDSVQLSLSRHYPFVSAAQVSTALELCHWQNNFQYSVRAGLAPGENLLFATEIRHLDFVVSNIHRAFELLCRLHEQVLAT